MTKLIALEGIGETYDAKLKGTGVKTLEALLEKGADPKGRKDLASAAGIDVDLILKWVNRADLFRVKGVGEEYSDLLEAAGVDTVVELAQRNGEHLYAKLVEVNGQKKLVRQLPSQAVVEGWIVTAKGLPRVVSY
jgi:predicted flap endonuclease-1-like 5' DNA nuclease